VPGNSRRSDSKPSNRAILISWTRVSDITEIIYSSKRPTSVSGHRLRTLVEIYSDCARTQA